MSLRAFSVSVKAQNGVWRAEDGIWQRIPLIRFVRQTADMSVWRDGVLDEFAADSRDACPYKYLRRSSERSRDDNEPL